MKVFFAQLIPNMLDRIQLGAVGRLGDQTDIVRDNQIVCPVPASSIHLHDNEVRGKDAADPLQEAIHHRRGDFWQNQRDHLTQGWGHRSIGIKVLSHHLCRSMGTHPRWCPAAFGATDAAKTAFVLRHDEHGALISCLSRGDRCFHLCGKVFLNCSRTCSSAFGCRGRGISLRHPWRCSSR